MKIASVPTPELATLQLKKSQKKIHEKFNSFNFLPLSFFAIFSAVASPVQGSLHLRFSLRAGDMTKFEKIARVAVAKRALCTFLANLFLINDMDISGPVFCS